VIHVISGGEFEEVDGELLAEFGDREDSFLNATEFSQSRSQNHSTEEQQNSIA